MKWGERFGELWESEVCQEILTRRHCHLHRYESLRPLSWKYFYFEFEWSWIDWLIGGYNAEDGCYVGIDGAVYDLTKFLEQHPGSKETILIHAGSDATAFFEDVGHSVQARVLMESFLAVKPNTQVDRLVLHSVSSRLEATQEKIRLAMAQSSSLSTFEARQGGSRSFCKVCQISYSLRPYESEPCGSCHPGLLRPVYDAISGTWWSWWSCCGKVVLEADPVSV
jgi:predicted heme/steroid binding protein